MTLWSIYIHIPFCRHRCGYCDFNTYARQEDRIADYINALESEIRQVAAAAPQKQPVHTIFFGGGTPSLIPVKGFEQIFRTLRDHFSLTDSIEATFEANPGTVNPEYLHSLRQIGLNRISLGMQSALPEELKLLERQHAVMDVARAVEWARKAGFDNLSLDLIYGLPGQSLASWQASLKQALAFEPDHLSIYCLTIEAGTPLMRKMKRGLFSAPDEDLAADMLEWSMNFLPEHGLEQYEISNFARQDARGELRLSRHNRQYWRNEPYLGFGAGAHGSMNGVRTENVARILAYIARCQTEEARSFPLGPAVLHSQKIDAQTEMQETMMVGLRLTREGVHRSGFLQRFGQELTTVYGKQIDRLVRLGLLEWAGEDQAILRLTWKGRLLGNQVFMEFVG